MLTIALMALSFGAGYFVCGHPQDTRSFAVRVRDSTKALFNKVFRKGN